MQQPEGDVSSQATGAGSSSADLVSSDIEERGWPNGRDAQVGGGCREEGEGQGPRKEFFALVGAGMTSASTGRPHVLQICVCACPSPAAANQICERHKAKLDRILKLDLTIRKSSQCMLLRVVCVCHAKA